MRKWSKKEIKEFENYCISHFQERILVIEGDNGLYFHSMLYETFRKDIAVYICEHKSYRIFEYDGSCVVLNFGD